MGFLDLHKVSVDRMLLEVHLIIIFPPYSGYNILEALLGPLRRTVFTYSKQYSVPKVKKEKKGDQIHSE